MSTYIAAPAVEKMLTQVNTFRNTEQYLVWLAGMSSEDFAVWSALPTAKYFERGAIEEEQRKRQVFESSHKRPSQKHREPWIFAERQQGEYPEDTDLSGKWMVFPLVTEIDNIWFIIADAVEKGKLGDEAKVATRPGLLGRRAGLPDTDVDDRVICVYTYNSEDKKDLLRILQHLRDIGVSHTAFYKENIETRAGNYAGFNLDSRQLTTRSPVKYYARPGKVELLIPKSRQ